MNTSTLALAAALMDHELLTRLETLAGDEREAMADLIVHLAVLHSRPSVYAARGYGSLFAYCTQALRFSEDAAYSRIEVAKACRRFPEVLDCLASGSLTLTSVRLLAPHLTPENHQAVLARAMGRTCHQIEALVAELAPRPDVPTSIRKLPTAAMLIPSPSATVPGAAGDSASAPVLGGGPPASVAPARRPVIQATAPQRYRVQFTIDQETHDTLRRLQDLLRREIP